MRARFPIVFLMSSAVIAGVAAAQSTDPAAAAPVAIETATPTEVPPAIAPLNATVNEDEMADFLNSQQQIKQGVTLTKSVDGKVVETKTETIIYSKDDPIRGSEAGMSPLERLKAEFDSESLTRREALEEAKLDFVIADLDRNEMVDADEFVFLVKGWQDAEISGAGRGRFVDPVFHVDESEAEAEHASQARAKFAVMAGADLGLTKKAFTRKVIEVFEVHDVNNDELLQGDELLAFRAAVRGENVTP